MDPKSKKSLKLHWQGNSRHRKSCVIFSILSFFILFIGLIGGSTWSASRAQADSLLQFSALEPGSNQIFNNRLYATQQSASWMNAGDAISDGKVDFSSTLVNNQLKSVGYEFYKNELDMTKAFELSGDFSFKGDVLENIASPFAVGDGLGFILTPSSVAQVNANAAQVTVTGGNLGIKGLSSSVFVGRDFYHNSDIDKEVSGAEGPSDEVSIRTTDAAGNLLTGGYAIADAPEAEQSAFNQTYTDKMLLYWTPSSVESVSGKVTGTLTYVIETTSGQPVEISEVLQVQKQMNVGVLGGTGGYSGVLRVENMADSQSAMKSVTVNYLNQANHQSIAQSSTISTYAGNLLSTYGNMAEKASLIGYALVAPQISNYVFASADVVQVSSDDENQVLNVYYKEKEQPKAKGTVNFKFHWSSSVQNPSIDLPQSVRLTGEDEAVVKSDLDQTLSKDYKIDKVIAPNGRVYGSVNQALVDYPKFVSNQTFDFEIYLSPLKSTPAPKPDNGGDNHHSGGNSSGTSSSSSSDNNSSSSSSSATSKTTDSSSETTAVLPISSSEKSAVQSTSKISESKKAKAVKKAAVAKTTTTSQPATKASSAKTTAKAKVQAKAPSKQVAAGESAKKTVKSDKSGSKKANLLHMVKIYSAGAGGMLVGMGSSAGGLLLLKKFLLHLR